MLRLSASLSLISLCLLWLVSCSKRANDEQCAALLNRYVELLAKSDGRDPSADEILRLQRDARVRAAKDPEFARCSERVTEREYECAMRAHSADEIERCLL